MLSFFPFRPKANRTIEAIAPNKKDKNIHKKILGIPKTKPKTLMSFISPPPIPPLEKAKN